jgi:hypothetical protein
VIVKTSFVLYILIKWYWSRTFMYVLHRDEALIAAYLIFACWESNSGHKILYNLHWPYLWIEFSIYFSRIFYGLLFNKAFNRDSIQQDVWWNLKGSTEENHEKQEWTIVSAEIRNDHVVITSRKHYRCADFPVTMSVRLPLLWDPFYKPCGGVGGWAKGITN